MRPHRAPAADAITAVVFVESSPEQAAVGVRSLLARTDCDVIVGVLYPGDAGEFSGLGARVTTRPVGSVSQLVNETYAQRRTHIAVLHDVALLPPDPFATARQWLDDDVRIASVSFLSNAAEFMSFPHRNQAVTRPPDGHDETTTTRLLRTLTPQAIAAPVMYATGPVVVLSATALGAVGELVAPASARFDIAVADYCARARAKGFVDVADTSTFVWRPSDVARRPLDETLTFDDRGWLLHRHPSLIEFLDRERADDDSAFALAHGLARVKVAGLRVLIDGGCFGPNQVGTQVATAHTIRALAARPDVASVTVALPGPIPAYAADTLTLPKVTAEPIAAGDLRAYGLARGGFDVAFRPYQPVPGWDVDAWRAAAKRLVISVLDTIAFHNGGYFGSSGEWLAYRDHLRACIRVADAVTVISDDVIAQMRLHALPLADARLHSIPLGTEHLSGHEPTELPAELAARGFTTGPFALCLGVNYTHKNRELALDAHELVRAAGHDLALVMAGASVPHGTTRLAEARRGPRDHVFVVPELRDPEKNWLLRHASLVWYPTSAEGFGLVPFEAASFGTPTVAVDFGPLHELLSDPAPDPAPDTAPDPASGAPSGAPSGLPMLARDWTAEELARVGLALLADPGLAQRHAEAIRRAGARYSWSRTAASLVELFRAVLAIPAR